MLANNNNLLADYVEAILEFIWIWIYAFRGSLWGQTSHFQGVSHQNIEEYKDIDYKNIIAQNATEDTLTRPHASLSQAQLLMQ